MFCIFIEISIFTLIANCFRPQSAALFAISLYETPGAYPNLSAISSAICSLSNCVCFTYIKKYMYISGNIFNILSFITFISPCNKPNVPVFYFLHQSQVIANGALFVYLNNNVFALLICLIALDL